MQHAAGVAAADINNLVLGTFTCSAMEVVPYDVGSVTNSFTVVAAGATSNASTELASPDSRNRDTAGSVASQELCGNSAGPESTDLH